MNHGDNLGDRMKSYEDAFRMHLPPRLPIIVRVDGRAFHTLLKDAERPFDAHIAVAMNHVLARLMTDCQGTVLGYTQSDEASILLQSDLKDTTEQFFGGNLQKIVSITASIATVSFNFWTMFQGLKIDPAHFDSRAFVMPWEDVPNYFLWRFKDCTKNSVSMAARAVFSHKDCLNHNTKSKIELLRQAGQPYEDQPDRFKYGRFLLPLSKTDLCAKRAKLNEGAVNYNSINELIQAVLTEQRERHMETTV